MHGLHCSQRRKTLETARPHDTRGSLSRLESVKLVGPVANERSWWLSQWCLSSRHPPWTRQHQHAQREVSGVTSRSTATVSPKLLSDWRPDGQLTMTMTMTHSEKSHINQMRAWPYRQECRGHGPTKKNLSYWGSLLLGKVCKYKPLWTECNAS